MTTVPAWRTWRTCALVYFVFLVCAIPVGLTTGLLRASVSDLSTSRMVGATLLAFVHPAFLEEIVFRGLLLPRDAGSMGRGRLALVAAAALALYVAAHPLNALLFRPAALSLFASPAYLALASLLGLTCTVTYFISRSIWPPVAIHWVSVVVWLWFLGGQALLC